MVQPIDNSNLVNLGSEGAPIALFTPAVAYTYNATTKVVEAYDHSTFPAGDGLKKAHIKVLDHKGGEIRGTITATLVANKITIDVSTLDASRGLTISAAVITNNNLIADGSFKPIVAAGELSSWDKNAPKFP